MASASLYNILGLCVILIIIFDQFVYVNCASQFVNVSWGTTDAAINNHQYFCGPNTQLRCSIHEDVTVNFVQWVKYNGNKPPQIIVQKKAKSGDFSIILEATLNSNGNGLYSCQYDDPAYLSKASHTFNITVTIQDSINNGCQTAFNTSSSDTSTIGTHFPGLNPLIYTVVSALFLGILILVSIITCWIRSRKNSRLRSLLPQESPQDYLDYIQQGEFTPLTTSEFIASLRERPPTYNESEVIQRQLGTTEDNDTPPVPPRNNSTRGSPMEEDSSRDPLGNLSTTEVLFENIEAITATPIPNLFPDDYTVSFLLDDSPMLLQEPPSSLTNGDGDNGASSNSSETTNLLFGVIPSINDAVV